MTASLMVDGFVFGHDFYLLPRQVSFPSPITVYLILSNKSVSTDTNKKLFLVYNADVEKIGVSI